MRQSFKIKEKLFWRWTDTGKIILFIEDKDVMKRRYIMFYDPETHKCEPSKSWLEELRKELIIE